MLGKATKIARRPMLALGGDTRVSLLMVTVNENVSLALTAKYPAGRESCGCGAQMLNASDNEELKQGAPDCLRTHAQENISEGSLPLPATSGS